MLVHGPNTTFLSCLVVGWWSVNEQAKTFDLGLKRSRNIVVMAKAGFMAVAKDIQIVNEPISVDSQSDPTGLERKIILFRDLRYRCVRKGISGDNEYFVVRKYLTFLITGLRWNVPYLIERVSRNIVYNGLGQGLSVILGFVAVRFVFRRPWR